VADSAFAAGSPFDQVPESSAVFGGSPGGAGLAFAGYGNGFDAEFVEFVLDAGFAVARGRRSPIEAVSRPGR
jgi:hypothetical protein